MGRNKRRNKTSYISDISNIKTKEELLRNLDCTKNSFYISTFGIHNLRLTIENSKNIPNLCSMNKDDVDEGYPNYTLPNFIRFMNSKSNPSEAFYLASDDAFESVLRKYVTEMFEFIKDYVNFKNDYNKFSNEPFYPMFRCIRNCLSHNFLITKRMIKEIESSGSVSLYGVTIDESHLGKTIFELGFNRGKLIKLCEDARSFANELE